MKVELSERMQAVASLVSKTGTAADVGCDHGYVAIWLVQNKVCDKVIAMDIHKGPLECAAKNIQIYGVEQYIETRLSNGTQALALGEADSLVCAGMGGKLMMQILEDGADKVQAMKELILQPQSELCELRRYLREHGMGIVEENMIRDGDKFYPVMKVKISFGGVPSAQTAWQQRLEDTYGPYLLQHAHPVLEQYLHRRLEICRTIRKQLLEAIQPNDRQMARAEEIQQEMQDVKAVLENYYIVK